MAPPKRRHVKFPLPQEYFPPPNFNETQKEILIQTGLEALTKLVRDTRLRGGPIDWILDYDEQGVQIYWGSDIGHAKETVFMSVTELQATLDEADEIHESDDDFSYREFSDRFNDDVCDCRIIETLAPKTPTHPHNYVGVKWLCFEPPPPVRNRDFVFVECRDDFNLNGVKGWARVIHSVDLPQCVPDFRRPLGLVRAKFVASGTVFKEIPSRPGYLQVLQLFNLDLGGKVPMWMQRIGMKKRTSSLVKFDKHFRAKRMSSLPLVDEEDLVRKSARKLCFLCQTRFSPFVTRHHCRLCGEVVCRHCSRRWELTDPRHVTRSVRACVKCSTETASSSTARTVRSEPADARGFRAVSMPKSCPVSPPPILEATCGNRRRRVVSAVAQRGLPNDDIVIPSSNLKVMETARDWTETLTNSATPEQLRALFQQMKKLKLEERFGSDTLAAAS
ncbi:unnamed protein product [Aphanomyces euteiches]